MKRLLPFPWVSMSLFFLWLLLNQSIAPAHLLFAICLGIATPLLTRKLQPLGYPRLAKPIIFAQLLCMALVEIVRSCINVSRIILFAKPAQMNSQFIKVPLDMRNPYGLAMLSCLINSTPGTVWVEILDGRPELALHVFDLHDEQWWIETIKGRYEKPLMKIFE